MPVRPKVHKPKGYQSSQERKAEADKKRPSACKRGYGREWQRIRKAHLSKNPLCIFCLKEGVTEAATVVDHIDGDSFNNTPSNHRSLCKRCHDKRTGRDQAFGRKHHKG